MTAHGSSPGAGHQPVMVEEIVRILQPKTGTILVDGTVGAGGHSLALLPHLLPAGRLVAVDRDRDALQLARERLREFEPQVTFLHGNYRELPQRLKALHLARVDGLLLDVGLSSVQVESAQRGFSFAKAGPLDMRMDGREPTTAATLVNRLTLEELTTLLATLGEERFARRIARRIVEERRLHPITTTTDLARIVVGAFPPQARHGRLHPATRTFQALRIAVNDELGSLEELLGALPELLVPGGRAAIVTFHSLEDRLVKHAFLRGARAGLWRVLTKRPMRPMEAEVSRNPRARSAKLRAVERC